MCCLSFCDPNHKSDAHIINKLLQIRGSHRPLFGMPFFMAVHLVVMKLDPFWLDIGGGPKGVFALQGM